MRRGNCTREKLEIGLKRSNRARLSRTLNYTLSNLDLILKTIKDFSRFYIWEQSGCRRCPGKANLERSRGWIREGRLAGKE